MPHRPRLEAVALVLLRTLIGWHFLYEGYYKLVSPGWTRGGAPVAAWSASGYLKAATGPLAGAFHALGQSSMAGWVDHLVPLGLVLVGLSLMLGLLTQIGLSGALAFLTLFYVSAIPTEGIPEALERGDVPDREQEPDRIGCRRRAARVSNGRHRRPGRLETPAIKIADCRLQIADLEITQIVMRVAFSLLLILTPLATWSAVVSAPEAPFQAVGAQRDVTKVYAEVCAACHGAKLEGGKAQTLLDDTWVFGGDDASMATTIREGRLAAGMPAFATLLTGPEIRAMVYYLRETRATLRAGKCARDQHARRVGAQERAPRLSHRDRRRRADDARGA